MSYFAVAGLNGFLLAEHALTFIARAQRAKTK